MSFNPKAYVDKARAFWRDQDESERKVIRVILAVTALLVIAVLSKCAS